MSSNLLPFSQDGTVEEIRELALEYGQLVSLPTLTELQSERLQEILDLACESEALSLMIGELDHIIAHETGLLSPRRRDDYDNKKALLQEYLIEVIEERTKGKSPQELRTSIREHMMERNNPGTYSPSISQNRPQLGNDYYYSGGHESYSGKHESYSGKHESYSGKHETGRTCEGGANFSAGMKKC